MILMLLIAGGVAAYNHLIYLPTFAETIQRLGYDKGTMSDLYPRWFGTRALLINHQDPYGPEVFAAAEYGYFGRSAYPGEQLSNVAVFGHPLYLAFLLAPLAALDFPLAAELSRWGFPALVALGTVLWWSLINRAARPVQYLVVALAALTLPATLEIARVQGLTGPTYFFLALAIWLLIHQRLVPAGIVLATVTVRPQESWGVVALVLGWALFDLRSRGRVLWSFTATLAAGAALAELWLPGWFLKWLAATQQYVQDTAAERAFTRLLPLWVLVVAAVAWLALFGVGVWFLRHESLESPAFVAGLAGALAVTQILLPTYLQYEEVYLLPAVAVLLGYARQFSGRWLFILHRVTTALLLFPWPAACLLGYLAAAGMLRLSTSLFVRLSPMGLGTVLPYCAVIPLLILVGRLARPHSGAGRFSAAVGAKDRAVPRPS
jgi:hypothetical protein